MSTLDIRAMYQVSNRVLDNNIGIQGYHVDKKYLDPNQIR